MADAVLSISGESNIEKVLVMWLKYMAMAVAVLTLGGEVSAAEWHRMRLAVDGIEVQRGGHVYVYLFLDDGFPIRHERAVKRYRFAAESHRHEIVIEVPDVAFALKVHHDEDGTGTVTKNWTGLIPAEGLGFSAGARLRLGPPSFKDAMMIWPEGGETTVTVIYP